MLRQFQNDELISVTIPAKRDAFSTLKDWLLECFSSFELSQKIVRQLLIVADEIFTNIASYGYPAGDGDAKVAISFDTKKSEVALIFSDRGVFYNPLEKPELDVKAHVSAHKIGGLGIFMVKKIMDSVEYFREDEQNILILKKVIE